MELSVGERLVLLSVLPVEGDFVTLKIVRDLRGDLSFSEEELKELGIVQSEGMVQWADGKNTTKDVPIGEKATDIIGDALKKLNEAKILREEHIPLYEKFIEKNKE